MKDDYHIFVIALAIFSVFTKSLWTHILDLQSFYGFLNTFGEPKMNFKDNWFNDFMTFLASYGDIATFITLIIATIVLIKRCFLLAIGLPTTVASAGIIGIALKDIIHRSRPYDHLTIDARFSFPSGHALTSTMVIFALIFVLILKLGNIWVKYIINTVLIVVWLGILFSR
ncbi:phosphatase PAP2 family protein [Staphylococcus hominis]|uniref:phosphatase PAP2 family protein n=1 Tax=Staphylococcus hominis TaxID=1290 RepID=UPI0035124F2D